MRDESNASEPEWVVVREFSGVENEVQADLTVALLEGSDIPVLRVPAGNAPVVFDGMGGPMLPVTVLVPADREAEALELIESSEA